MIKNNTKDIKLKGGLFIMGKLSYRYKMYTIGLSTNEWRCKSPSIYQSTTFQYDSSEHVGKLFDLKEEDSSILDLPILQWIV